MVPAPPATRAQIVHNDGGSEDDQVGLALGNVQ